MTTQQIKEQLCHYDKRNPLRVYRETDEPHNTDNCYCDNCFRGKHELANELLRVEEELTKEKEDFKILERCYLGIE